MLQDALKNLRQVLTLDPASAFGGSQNSLKDRIREIDSNFS